MCEENTHSVLLNIVRSSSNITRLTAEMGGEKKKEKKKITGELAGKNWNILTPVIEQKRPCICKNMPIQKAQNLHNNDVYHYGTILLQ